MVNTSREVHETNYIQATLHDAKKVSLQWWKVVHQHVGHRMMAQH